jgi:sugar O-acyltransferase (sialic acid O-acetyltransferase NeuD family)
MVQKPPDFIEFPLSEVFQGIHQRIEQQAHAHREKIAISAQDTQYTYAELNGRANSLADIILSAAGSELGQVAILQSNTPDLIVSLLASLKAHKAYVPLDCNFPRERLRAMMSDSEAEIILADRQHLLLAEELRTKDTQIILDVEAIDRHIDAPDPEIPCDPMDRAYILYTSGTTGKPKGIEFLHRNLLHTTMCLTNQLFYSPSDRVSWLHSPSFGSSIVDIYNCLTNGGTLFPWDTKTQGFNGMAEWVKQSRLTAFHWVPSAFRQFMMTVPRDMIFDDIRIVVMAGETLTVREVEIFRRNFPVGSHLVNQVGTAESYNYHLYSIDHQIPIAPPNVPGGYPVSPHRKVLILDESHAELPAGAEGEIAIKSDYMAAGYWRNKELTEARFIRMPGDDTPVYLTGDLGKFDESGCLTHLGRKDFQFKIRGCRVELAEIDQALLSAPGVQDAITWVHKNRRGEDELIGYIVPRRGTTFRQERMEDHLRSRLPAYMIPRRYVRMEELPMLPTGKTDRKSLPDPFAGGRDETDPNLPGERSTVARVIAIFKELLRTDGIGADSDFFEGGGDSLLAAVLVHRLSEIFRVDMSPDQLPQNVTPGQLARLIEVGGGRPTFRRLDRSGENGHGAGQGILTRRKSCAPRSYDGDQSTYGASGNLVIIGAGQCGREVFTWALQSIDYGTRLTIKGFLDDKLDALQGYNYDLRVLASVDEYEIEPGDVFIGAIGNPAAKARCCSRIEEKGGRFINIIHPLANIGKNVRLGTGLVLAPFSSVTVDAQIGSHVSVGAFSNLAHDTVIGDFAQISSHCGVNGMASLGEGVFLGSHACILPAVHVGAWAYVGAGSVVVREVQDGVKVFGNPATVIGRSGTGQQAPAPPTLAAATLAERPDV